MAARVSRRDRKRIARAAQEAQTAQSVVDFAEVISVDADAGEATVELADGTKTTIYKNVGVLPGVGDMVPGVRNGGDFVPIGGRHLIDGAFTSGDGFDPDGEASWGLFADGILRCLGAIIEGAVIAREFRTRADFEAEGGIQIDSEAYNRLLFRRAGPLEDDPSSINSESYDDTVSLRVQGVPGTSGFRPALILSTLGDGTIEVALDSADGPVGILGSERVTIGTDGKVEISAVEVHVEGDLRVDGRIRGGPVGCKLRNATGQSVAGSTATPIVNSTTDWNDNIPGTLTQCVEWVSPTSYRPRIAGRWAVKFAASINPEADGPYPLAVGFRINGGAVQRLSQVDTVNNAITGGGAAECVNTYLFNGTTDRIEFIVSHGDGSSKTVFAPVMEFVYMGPA